ncbi:hypothetical protein GGI21_005735, partial [Coemansia aciculifera]
MASEDADEVDSTSATEANEHSEAVRLQRRDVIRRALLRQGQSESDIAKYFGQYTEGTSRNYDGVWNKWVQ